MPNAAKRQECEVCGRKFRRPSDSTFIIWSSIPERSGKRVCKVVCRRTRVTA